MASSSRWLRYIFAKFGASLSTGLKSYQVGQISGKEFRVRLWKEVFQERLTILRSIKGKEMEPTFSSQGETLLVRKLPSPSSRSVFVGDVVVLKDPRNQEKELIRRVSALEDDEMVSSNENDEPFHIEEGHCWVLCDNESISPKNAADSRTFGPISMRSIIGRAIYCSRSSFDHGIVSNSDEALRQDSSVLAVELDLDEMFGNTKT